MVAERRAEEEEEKEKRRRESAKRKREDGEGEGGRGGGGRGGGPRRGRHVLRGGGGVRGGRVVGVGRGAEDVSRRSSERAEEARAALGSRAVRASRRVRLVTRETRDAKRFVSQRVSFSSAARRRKAPPFHPRARRVPSRTAFLPSSGRTHAPPRLDAPSSSHGLVKTRRFFRVRPPPETIDLRAFRPTRATIDPVSLEVHGVLGEEVLALGGLGDDAAEGLDAEGADGEEGGEEDDHGEAEGAGALASPRAPWGRPSRRGAFAPPPEGREGAEKVRREGARRGAPRRGSSSSSPGRGPSSSRGAPR